VPYAYGLGFRLTEFGARPEPHSIERTKMSSIGKKTAAIAAAAAVALGLASCSGATGSGSGASEGSEPFRLLVVAAQSGILADLGGVPVTNGIKTMVRLLNDEGGIDGRQIDLQIVDSASDATQATSNVQAYLASNPKPDAIFAGMYSSEALPLAPITTQAGILSVTTAASSAVVNVKDFPYTFSAAQSPDNAAGALASEFAEKGYKKVAYLAQDTESGHAAVATFTQVSKSKGFDITSAFLPVDAIDATPVLESLRAGNPDVVIMNAPPGLVPVMLQGRTKLGWTVPTYGDVVFSAAPIASATSPADWKNLTLLAANYIVADTPMTTSKAFDTFHAAYLDDWGQDSLKKVAFSVACSGGSAILFIKAAYEATESNDVADLAATLEQLGNGPVPSSVQNLWIGPQSWGFSDKNHVTVWTPDDFSVIPVVPQVDGLYDPADAVSQK
jgi:branched-chain amino acid transport system substrate-binding protein